VPPHFKVLFMQGGGLAENALVPLNLSKLRSDAPAADFVVTGSWSDKSFKEAQKFCDAQCAASGAEGAFTALPPVSSWQLRSEASYVHVCTNETIHGVEFQQLPDLRALGLASELVLDFSSHVATRAVDWSRVGLAFGGAQKNLGPAGLTVVVVREDLLGKALPVCPSAFNYQLVADNNSMYNTPPTYAIYMAGLVFQWILRQGGVAAMERLAVQKSQALYAAIDGSQLYYNTVQPACRSRMNIPFFLRDARLNEAFLAQARAAGLLQLKGHKSVGGMRASLYNAMPLEGVHALLSFLAEFERTQG